MCTDSRRESLILTAIEIIDERGYQGLTIKELSKRQNITDAAIYKHFTNKKELVIGVLDYYNSFFLEIYKSIEITSMTALEALEFYICRFLELYEEHPAVTAILNSYETFWQEKELSKCVIKIFNGRLALLTHLFQRGIDSKEFDESIGAESLAYIMIGTMTSVSLNWRMQEHQFSLTDKIQLIQNELKAKIIT